MLLWKYRRRASFAAALFSRNDADAASRRTEPVSALHGPRRRAVIVICCPPKEGGATSFFLFPPGCNRCGQNHSPGRVCLFRRERRRDTARNPSVRRPRDDTVPRGSMPVGGASRRRKAAPRDRCVNGLQRAAGSILSSLPQMPSTFAPLFAYGLMERLLLLCFFEQFHNEIADSRVKAWKSTPRKPCR